MNENATGNRTPAPSAAYHALLVSLSPTDVPAVRVHLNALADRADPRSDVLATMGPREQIAEIEIGFGRLGEPLSSSDVRASLNRMRR